MGERIGPELGICGMRKEAEDGRGKEYESACMQLYGRMMERWEGVKKIHAPLLPT